MSLNSGIRHHFTENSYVLEEHKHCVSIESPINRIQLSVISVIGGIVVVFFGLASHILIFLMGLIMVFSPFVYLSVSLPRRVDLDTLMQTITIQGLSGRKIIHTKEHWSDIFVERYTNSTFVSAFENGNKEFVYEFHLRMKSSTPLKLFRLTSKQETDKSMQMVAYYLNSLMVDKK
ncbi:MAG: hypothetical protein ABJF11_10515 [Reichenbachiella sp.]|uniref:hypothetical protein n=1 Tax=Reichenbachiella sp. TaxID=2184521 RepID=UPI003264D3CA